MVRTTGDELERPADGVASGSRPSDLSIEPLAGTVLAEDSVAEDSEPRGATPSSPRAIDLTTVLADLRATLGELKCLGSERLRRHGVSMGHLHAMALLERHGHLTMTRFAEFLDVSLSNVTGLVDRMEERGLVRRTRIAGDRRIVLVELTDHGRRLLEEMDLLRNDLLARVLDRLEPESVAAIATAIARLRDVLQEALREAQTEAHSEAGHSRTSPPSGSGPAAHPLGRGSPRDRET